MKKLTFTILAALVTFFIIQGCNKDMQPVIGVSKIKAEKLEVKVGELDTFVYTGATNTDSVKWTITPTNSSIGTKSNVARIVFNKVGIYVVTAGKAGEVPSRIAIKVDPADPIPVDTVKTPTDTTKYVPLTGDKITLGFGAGRNANGGDTVVVTLNAVTTNTYCSRGVLQYQFNRPYINGVFGYKVDFVNVREPKVCSNTPDIPMSASNIFYSGMRLAVGSYPLIITLNGTTYSGSIVVSETQVTIDWNYTTGVIFPYKVLDRPL